MFRDKICNSLGKHSGPILLRFPVITTLYMSEGLRHNVPLKKAFGYNFLPASARWYLAMDASDELAILREDCE